MRVHVLVPMPSWLQLLAASEAVRESELGCSEDLSSSAYHAVQ